MNWRQIIIGGLLLPLRVYLRPHQFRSDVAALAPELRIDYTLWQARHKLRDPVFRQGLTYLLLQSLIAMLWVPALAILFQLHAHQIKWSIVALGVAFGVAVGVMEVVVLGVAFGVALGVAFGVAGGVAGGVALGVAGVETLGVASGVAFGVVAGVLAGVVFGKAGGEAVGVAVGVAGGVVFGVVLGVAFRSWGGVAQGVALGVAAIAFSTHILNYLPQLIISSAGWVITRFDKDLSTFFWRISPVRWDDVILLPLPGLPRLLATLVINAPELGEEAINEVAAHHFRHKAAARARMILATEDARQIGTLPSLANFERSLAWLSSDSPLPEETRRALLRMRDISQEVAAALESDSVTNKVRRLETASKTITLLRSNPGPFGPVIKNWAQMVESKLEEARSEQRALEPIPQHYLKDGSPINPDDLPEELSPFKGRGDTVRQLVAELGQDKRTTILLYGARRSGKSSLLLQLPRKLGSQIIPAFLDCQSEKIGGSQNAAGMLTGIAETIVEQGRRNASKYRRDPVRFPPIDHKSFAADPYPSFGRWLQKTEKALGARTLLLCLDEFEKLEMAIQNNRVDLRLLDFIRHTIQHRPRITILLSGSHHISELPRHWADALVSTSLLTIGFLNEPEARELITQPVSGFPQIYQQDAVERILRLTRSQPFLAQVMCGLLVDRMNNSQRQPPESYVGLDDVEAVIPEALKTGDAYFSDLWQSQTGGDCAQRILERMAYAHGERLSLTEIRAILPDDQERRETLRTLKRREIIEQIDDGFCITVPLVAEYVRLENPQF